MPKFLLNQVAEVQKYQGSGAYGPSYAEPVEHDCRFQPQQKEVTNENGEEIVSNGKFFFSGDVEINVNSIITYNNRDYEVVEVGPIQGLRKINHYEVVVK